MSSKIAGVFLISLSTACASYGQITWESADDTSFIGTVLIHGQRLGYSYYKSHIAELGYGFSIGRQDLTIDDEKQLFLTNIKKVSHSFTVTMEYMKRNDKSVWAPK